jgi:hypothetical protein
MIHGKMQAGQSGETIPQIKSSGRQPGAFSLYDVRQTYVRDFRTGFGL